MCFQNSPVISSKEGKTTDFVEVRR